MFNKQQSLETMRHSAAHVLAAAVQRLYPEAKFGVGPVIDNGFYYDIDLGTISITPLELLKIEKEMNKLVKANLSMEKKELPLAGAIQLFMNNNQVYKVELLNDLLSKGSTKMDESLSGFSPDQPVTIYQTGDFIDLCRGPHVKSTKEIGVFKLTTIAGAYWRGDEKNKMLTRIYGLCFAEQKELDQHLQLLEEAKKRDHRKLGKELDLFHLDDLVGLGLPLWHPKGALLWRKIEDFWYQEHLTKGYQLVRTPHIGNRQLWETSGHWGFYNKSMYPPLEAGQSLEDAQLEKKSEQVEEYLLKPMNCPFHVQIYKNDLRSYRELPLRWAECGTVYRYEKKGELSGLTRVRGFTQDDAHIICREDQVAEELKRVIDFILYIYQQFGFAKESVKVFLSLRDPENKDKYAGSDAGWDFTERILKQVAQEKKLDFAEELGEAAFYGPKLDFKIADCLGRLWQCSTLQFDFNLPERFEMSFINAQGEKEKPYMLHRALFGSFERFIGLLIENYAGAFPLWLSPVQIALLPVGETHKEYCQQLAQEFRNQGFIVEVDEANETIGNKIRKAAGQKIPYQLVIGDKEMGLDKLSIRVRGQVELINLTKEEFIAKLKKEIAERQ